MKCTPFHVNHAAAGGQFGPVGEWTVPTYYSSAVEEHYATRNRVTMTDFSTMCKFDFKGPDAAAFLQKLVVNDINKLRPGKALYSAMCYENGEFVDDVTVYMYGENHYMLVGGIPAREKDDVWFQQKKEEFGYAAYITDTTSAFGLLSVAGPLSRELLKKLCDPSFTELKSFEFGYFPLGGINCILSRTGVTGELGYEIIANAEDCPAIWDALVREGEEFGVIPCGMAASGTLRMEKGYISGREFLTHTNPYEMGLGWSVALNTDFIGRDALCKVHEEGPARKLCAFQIPDKTIIAPAQSDVMVDGKVIGKATSCAWLPTLDISYGMITIPVEYAVPGTHVSVRIAENQIVDAVIVEKNLYDPTGSRIKG